MKNTTEPRFDYSGLGNMCYWEREKAIYLMQVANDLDYDFNEFGEINVNQSSGNVYLWSENYTYCLFMPINCELSREYVYASYSDPDDGEEFEFQISTNNLDDVEAWIEEIQNEKYN